MHESQLFVHSWQNNKTMFQNYLKIALRNLWKNKGFATINISGLMVAFCIGSLLILTAYLQLTFDSFHQNSKQIYQAYFNFNKDGDIKQSGETPLPLYDGGSIKCEANFPRKPLN
jgi:putative ABC transport system permease protein